MITGEPTVQSVWLEIESYFRKYQIKVYKDMPVSNRGRFDVVASNYTPQIAVEDLLDRLHHKLKDHTNVWFKTAPILTQHYDLTTGITVYTISITGVYW